MGNEADLGLDLSMRGVEHGHELRAHKAEVGVFVCDRN